MISKRRALIALCWLASAGWLLVAFTADNLVVTAVAAMIAGLCPWIGVVVTREIAKK